MDSGLLGFGDLVITSIEEFDKAETMAERIGQVGDAPPALRLDFAFTGCTGGDGTADSLTNIRHHKVKVYRGPVAPIAAHLVGGQRGNRAVCLEKKVDGGCGAQQLHAQGTEPPP